MVHPFGAVPAKGFQAEAEAGVSRRVEMTGESEEFPVTSPQTSCDPSVTFDSRWTCQIGGLAPVQPVFTRRVGIAGLREIMMGHDIAMFLRSDAGDLPAGSVAPHGPEATVMMGEVGVLVNPGSALVADVAEDGVFGGDARKFRVVDLVRIVGQPVSRQRDGGIGILCRGGQGD